jgi:uncharacterized protein DUF4154
VVAQSSVEYQVKAAFIFNFLSFTQWPESAFAGTSDPLRVCVLRGELIARAIDATVRGEAIDGHPVLVEQIASAPDVARCHVLFVPKTEAAHAAELVRAAGDAPVLTVGESDQFLRDGGVVNFSIENGRVRFDVNQRVAREHGVNLSSKLLQIARSVK